MLDEMQYELNDKTEAYVTLPIGWNPMCQTSTSPQSSTIFKPSLASIEGAALPSVRPVAV